jgi:hypothetical protein
MSKFSLPASTQYTVLKELVFPLEDLKSDWWSSGVEISWYFRFRQPFMDNKFAQNARVKLATLSVKMTFASAKFRRLLDANPE